MAAMGLPTALGPGPAGAPRRRRMRRRRMRRGRRRRASTAARHGRRACSSRSSGRSPGRRASTAPRSCRRRTSRLGRKPPPSGGAVSVRQQLEYYFSPRNWGQDAFLKSLADEDGAVALEAFFTFPRIAALLPTTVDAAKTADDDRRVLAAAVRKSSQLDLTAGRAAREGAAEARARREAAEAPRHRGPGAVRGGARAARKAGWPVRGRRGESATANPQADVRPPRREDHQ